MNLPFTTTAEVFRTIPSLTKANEDENVKRSEGISEVTMNSIIEYISSKEVRK
jgi:hypothetical protein